MTSIVELTNFRRATLGSAGTVRLHGEDVAARHAEIVARESEDELEPILRPLDGPVSVERRGRVWPISAPWPLADGDTIIIGCHRLRYRDLGSPRDILDLDQPGKVISWLL